MPKILIRLQQLKTVKIEITSKHPIKSHRPIPTPHGGSILQAVADAVGAVITGTVMAIKSIAMTKIVDAFRDLCLMPIYKSLPYASNNITKIFEQIKYMFSYYIESSPSSYTIPKHKHKISCPSNKTHILPQSIIIIL